MHLLVALLRRLRHSLLCDSGAYGARMRDMDCLVLTTAHHPDDARLNRHLAGLKGGGLNAALVAVEMPRYLRLLAAPVVVLRTLRSVRPVAVVFPDPELFVAGPLVAKWMGIRSILDVHEDYQAVALARDWIPGAVRRATGWAAAAMVRWGRRLASATIVAAPHLARPGDVVVPNIPDEGVFPAVGTTERRMSVVYVGDVTKPRGLLQMLDVIRLVPEVTLELIGSVTPENEDLIHRKSLADGTSERIVVYGRLPYTEAWQQAAGAIAGLSLLTPTRAYREAIPSKLWEYMAAGLPIIASDLPAQRTLVEEAQAGVVVANATEAAAVVREWLDDPARAKEVGVTGREYYLDVESESNGSSLLVAAVTGS